MRCGSTHMALHCNVVGIENFATAKQKFNIVYWKRGSLSTEMHFDQE